MRRTVLPTIGLLLWAVTAMAVPETVSVRITDVTPSSFAVVWLTDVAAEPAVQVYNDSAMTDEITEAVRITPMPGADADVAAAARDKGIMKVRVAGLDAGATYYVRTVTVDPMDASSVGYSSPQQVTTTEAVLPYRSDADANLVPGGNDLVRFPVYIRPADTSEFPGLGDLLLLETDDAFCPISVFVGQGIATPEGLLDLNNLFGLDGSNLILTSDEKATLRIYRGGTLTTFLHYRVLPVGDGAAVVTEPVRGFFADVNLDGKVDGSDFGLFREQYRRVADDAGFNPDYNFIAVQNGTVGVADRVDAKDFARFATQYGREGVE